MTDRTNSSRRSFLQKSGALGLAGLAAPLIGFTRPALAAGQLEIFSWWTSAGEVASLEALIAGYEQKFPGTAVVNAAVSGGSGANALPVLQSRLSGGVPPDSWQGNPGVAFMTRYVDPGYVEDITDIYEQEGWIDTVPAALLDTIRKDGKYYAVHVGVRHCNSIWFNKAILANAQVEVEEGLSFDALFAAMEKVRDSGVTALAVGDNGIWANYCMLENTWTGLLGYEQTQKLWDGSLSFDAPEVKETFRLHLKMLEFQNSDHAALSWDQAVMKVADGSAAFNIMGDWAYAEFKKRGQQDDQEFGWISHPGTEDIFVFATDCFPVAKNAPNPEEARNWVKAAGSKETLEKFILEYGSVAPRLDLDTSALPPYQKWAAGKFGRSKFVGSSQLGMQVTGAFIQDAFDGLTSFLVSKDVDAFAETMTRAQQALKA